MLKKIGISFILAFTILVSTFYVGIVTTAYATSASLPCTTLEECRELQRTTRDNIAEIMEEEGEVSDYLTELQVEISELRDEISDLEDEIADLEEEISDLEDEIANLEEEIAVLEGEISDLEEEITVLEGEISDLEEEIADLENEIAVNIAILVDTEERIEELIAEISGRMRITQRVNNTNSLLTILSDAENLSDFIRRARTFNRIATDDAVFMDELTDLVDVQVALLFELDEQADQLQNQRDQLRDQTDQLQNQKDQLHDQADKLQEQTDQLQNQTDQLETLRGELELEQENLEADQISLVERETQMQDMLYRLNVERMTAEEMEAAAAEAEGVLARTPPPAVRSNRSTNTTSNTTSNTATSNTTSNTATSNTTSNTATSNRTPNTPTSNTTPNNSTPSVVQVSNSSGLAHPMPGARVTSEFGPRGGGHHSGIDLVIVGNPSAPVLAAATGTVTTNQWHNQLGWYVVISHNINGRRIDTLYAHLRYQPSTRVGAIVSQGQRIGTKGSTGQSTGAHLHFEVHPGGWAWGNSVNPRNWVGF